METVLEFVRRVKCSLHFHRWIYDDSRYAEVIHNTEDFWCWPLPMKCKWCGAKR